MTFPYDQTPAENMIDGQLAPNGITHTGLIDAVKTVAREQFVPEAFRAVAYVDEDVALGHGRFLMEPLTQLRLLQAMEVRADMSVLIIGGATGYSAALLSALVARVEVVEEDHALAAHARDVLKKLGMLNVNVVQGAHNQGAAGSAPYDVILIEGAIEQLPEALLTQLKDGGKLFAVEAKYYRPTAQDGMRMGMGQALCFEKRNDIISSTVLFDAAVGALKGFEAPIRFSFH